MTFQENCERLRRQRALLEEARIRHYRQAIEAERQMAICYAGFTVFSLGIVLWYCVQVLAR